MSTPTLSDRLAELAALAADCEAGSPPSGRTIGAAIVATADAVNMLADKVAALEADPA